MMKRAVIVFLVILCIIGVCVYAVQPLTHTDEKQAIRIQTKINNLSTQKGSIGDISFKFNIKLRDGVPILKLKLGQQRITVIFDTGSSHLNVSHHSCSGCNTADGVYNGEINDNRRRKIYYGSQHDTVVDMSDMLELPDGSGNNKLLHVPFVTTVSRQTGNQGNSSLNVMGVYPGETQDHNSFTSYILPNTYVLVVNLAYSGGYVAGVSKSKSETIRSHYPSTFLEVPLTRIKALPFYVVKIVGIDVCGKRLPGLSTIRWCVIDTGSNMLTLPPKVCKNTLSCINRAIHPSMTLYLDGGGKIQMHRKQLMWRGGNEAMIDDDIQAIGGSKALQKQTMVLGTHAMSGRCLMFTEDSFFVSV